MSQLDLERIAKCLRAKGFQRFEIFAETCVKTKVSHFDRIDSVQTLSEGGVNITADDEKTVRRFLTTEVSTGAVLAALEESGRQPSGQFPPGELKTAEASQTATDKFQTIAQVYRALEFDPKNAPVLEYEDELRTFQVYSSFDGLGNGSLREGTDEKAVATLRWRKEKAQRREQWHRRKIKELLNDLHLKKVLSRSFHDDATTPVRWPLPHGEVSTIWSAKAFAKLLLPLIRSAEGDSFLTQSFLAELCRDLPGWLNLVDIPETPASFDFQGTPRQRTSLFREGEFLQVATDRGLAAELGSEPTGHGRRDHFTASVGVGLWNVCLESPLPQAPLLEKMGNGIYLSDIALLHWNPRKLKCLIGIREGRLVHHGEIGELLEPAEMEIPLPALLHLASHQGQDLVTTGFSVSKPQGKFLMEISVPEILTESMPFPGSVPRSHYW